MIDMKRRIIDIVSLVCIIILAIIYIIYMYQIAKTFFDTFQELPEDEGRATVAIAFLVVRIFAPIAFFSLLSMLILIIVGLCLFKKPKACVFLIVVSAVCLPTTTITLRVGIENHNDIYLFLGVLSTAFGIANLIIQIYRTRLVKKTEAETQKTLS